MAILKISRNTEAIEDGDFVITYLKSTIRFLGISVYHIYSATRNEFTFEEKTKRNGGGYESKTLGFTRKTKSNGNKDTE